VGSAGQTAAAVPDQAAEKTWVRAVSTLPGLCALLFNPHTRTILFKHLPPDAVRVVSASTYPAISIAPDVAHAAVLSLRTWRRLARLLPVGVFRRLIKEIAMTRKYIDCREFPSEMNCTVALSADSESELLDAAVQHAVTVHNHADSPELRSQLKTLFHDGTPPVEAPRA
jgi:predicted small metal-binding protein